jgi:DNA-binding transcriptional regulator YdaS (Cro superfamily)
VPAKVLSGQELIAKALPYFDGQRRALASYLGRKESALSQWINGVRPMPAHTRRFLEVALGLHPPLAPAPNLLPNRREARRMPKEFTATWAQVSDLYKHRKENPKWRLLVVYLKTLDTLMPPAPTGVADESEEPD